MLAATVTNTEDLFINGLFKKNTQTDSNHVKLFVNLRSLNTRTTSLFIFINCCLFCIFRLLALKEAGHV